MQTLLPYLRSKDAIGRRGEAPSPYPWIAATGIKSIEAQHPCGARHSREGGNPWLFRMDPRLRGDDGSTIRGLIQSLQATGRLSSITESLADCLEL